MAKFSQNTLTQVGGFDGQVLAQELVYDQNDFWNFAWSTTVSNVVTPISLVGATINAQIIRRRIIDLQDGRTGLDFTIVDYPFPKEITTITATLTASDIMTGTSTAEMFIDQPVSFTGTVFGGVAINTTYYVIEIITAETFKISATSGGAALALSTATGSMVLNRVAPTAIPLSITNLDAAAGTFTMIIAEDEWDVIAGDPELDINADDPVCFTGRVKISFPAAGALPTYDEQVFLLFLVVSDGIVN